MTCIIIEDQRPAQEVLEKYIQDAGTLELTGIFTDALSAMHLVTTSPPDVIFLDIHLPKLSGLDFIQTLENPPKIILTTAFPDYALDGYELSVVDYLLKPFSFQRFLKAISKIQHAENAPSDSKQHLFIKSGYEHIKVAIEDIEYIMSDADYTEIFIRGQKLLSQESLKYWEDRLSRYGFIRTHKSYIVNCDKIEKITGSTIYIAHKVNLPLGRAYKEEFYQKVIK